MIFSNKYINLLLPPASKDIPSINSVAQSVLATT